MILLIILLSLPIFLLFLLHRRRASINGICWPPGPPGLPLIGHLLHYDNINNPSKLWELSKQYGPLMSLRLGFKPILVVSSAKMAKEFLKAHDLQFCGRPPFLGQQTLSYNGLDLALAPCHNAYSREMKKLCVVHLLGSNKVQLFRPIREDETSRMIEKISKSAEASSKPPVNLSEIMMSFTNMIICRIAFGRRYDEERSEKSRFKALLTETETILVSFFFSDYFPFISWVDKLTGMMSRLEKNFKEFDMFYQEIIQEHLNPNRSKAKQEDIVDVLLQVQKDSGLKVDLTWDHIKALLMNIFVGGTDTVAATLIWAMTYLMKNPRAMKKSQEETRNLIGNKDFVDEDDVQKLPYLKAVLKETMRLQPSIPLIPRAAVEKCNIEGYEIPSKTFIYVNSWAIGRDPEAWDRPEEFYPERFIGSSVDFKGQHLQLIPFGTGRRICPGINMATATVELALANLLFKFDWEMPYGLSTEDLDFDVALGISMHKKNALCLAAGIYI